MNGLDVLAVGLFLACCLVFFQEPTEADDADVRERIEDQREFGHYDLINHVPYDQELYDDELWADTEQASA